MRAVVMRLGGRQEFEDEEARIQIGGAAGRRKRMRVPSALLHSTPMGAACLACRGPCPPCTVTCVCCAR